MESTEEFDLPRSIVHLDRRVRLMQFLEREPARFDVLFGRLASTPRFADMVQRERNEFSPWEWMYLYAQAAKFSLSALRV